MAEAFIVSHGALALAGAITFVIGALMLFDPAGDAYQVSLPVAIAIAGTLTLLFGFALTKAVRLGATTPEVGAHRLVGETGQVRAESLVFVDGELWRARTRRRRPRSRRASTCASRPSSRTGCELVVVSKPANPSERT